ncbi:MAG: ABC transporter permease [Thermoanaerobaculia bacterium]
MKLVLGVAITLLMWHLVTVTGLVSPLYLPPLREVVESLSERLIAGVLTTTVRAVGGFALGLFVACGAHFLFVLLRIEAGMDQQFAGARAVPVIAVMPLFVIWFGFSESARLLVVVLSAATFFVAPFHEAYRALPREWTLLRHQLTWSTWAYYSGVAIPGSFGSLLGPLRVTLAIAFTMSIASEYLGAERGIGNYLDSARVTFNIPAMFLAIICTSVVGVTLDWILRVSYRHTIHWAARDAKA